MAITSLDGLVAGCGSGETIPFFFSGIPFVTAGYSSSWTVNGFRGAGSTPATGAGAVPTNTTAGALRFTSPAGGTTAYVAFFQIVSSAACDYLLYDRLVHTSGLSGTTTGAQTVNSAAVNRPDSTGANAEIWLEWYTATGSTARTVTASYTNQAGTASRTTQTATIPASTAARAMIRLHLQAGDTGVRSVQSVTLSASTGTAGNFGVTLLRPVATIAHGSDGGTDKNAFDMGLPDISSDSCLALQTFQAGGTLTVYGAVRLAKG